MIISGAGASAGPKESLYYQELRRRYRRQESSGRGEGATPVEKKRPVDCNKVSIFRIYNLVIIRMWSG